MVDSNTPSLTPGLTPDVAFWQGSIADSQAARRSQAARAAEAVQKQPSEARCIREID